MAAHFSWAGGLVVALGGALFVDWGLVVALGTHFSWAGGLVVALGGALFVGWCNTLSPR